MLNSSVIKEYRYSGELANLCKGFIAEKRAVGYLYNSEAKQLSEFSRFSQAFDIPTNTLTEEVVKAWIEKKPTDSDRTRYSRFSVIKMFAEYAHRVGQKAYVPTSDDIGKFCRTFIPYIFTHNEIHNFFKMADDMKYLPCSASPRRHIIMPVILKLLYCCGLRVTEALCLHGEDVDLNNGILTIRDSKFGKTRYVPMSEKMTFVCSKYAETRIITKEGIDWFFTAPDGGRYDKRVVYDVFRNLLWKAGISHGGRGKGPRLHDFRHTMAVHCLQKWIEQGIDLTNALPRLTAYLGHKGFKATEQYLRMTAEVYPEISKLLQDKYGHIIPKEGNKL